MKGVSVTVRCAGAECDGLIHLCGVVSKDPTKAGVDLARTLGWEADVDMDDGKVFAYCPACSGGAALAEPAAMQATADRAADGREVRR